MKYLHTMIRVGNLEKSISFYQDVLNFSLVKKQDYEDGKFTLAFLQAAHESGENPPMIELTYNWGVDKYELGSGYGHMAFSVSSMDEIQTRVEKHGFKFSWGPGKTPDGQRAMAFLKDPDGYQIELLEK